MDAVIFSQMGLQKISQELVNAVLRPQVKQVLEGEMTKFFPHLYLLFFSLLILFYLKSRAYQRSFIIDIVNHISHWPYISATCLCG